MIDLTYLRTTIGNDRTVISQLIQLFLEQLPGLRAQIENDYKEKNWKSLKDAAHKAKNSFQIMGAKAQSENLKKMEIIAENDPENNGIKALIDNFTEACDLVVEEIKQLKI